MRARRAAAALALLVGAQTWAVLGGAGEAGRERSGPPAGDLAAGATGLGADSSGPPAAADAAAAARRFLDRYVDGDGRVVRRDQGGDTVSEGQAYGMLAAAALGDRPAFDRIWGWARANLQRTDGLLSWRWDRGEVLDPEPAADADLDAAWALAVAAGRWGGAYAEAAAALVEAIATAEVADPTGDPFLAAGPWALSGDEVAINPSYASPVAAEVLTAVVGGPGSVTVAAAVDGLVDRTADLVDAAGVAPDWASAAPGATARAGRPGSGDDAGFGWDAARVPLRLAASCDDGDRRLAADHWEPMTSGAGVATMGEHPARLLAAAAAAAAAGEPGTAASLLDRAVEAESRGSTYYGAALLAVGRVLLETDALGGCPLLATATVRSGA